MQVDIVTGDLLNLDVEVIVNAWNRNIIPWWLLQPHGISGAIKRMAGSQPFQELAQYGSLQPGQAVLTGPGKLHYRAIIHVAAISLWGRSNEQIIRASLRNTIALAKDKQFQSIAFPILGSGSGGVNEQIALSVIVDELSKQEYNGRVVVVQYKR